MNEEVTMRAFDPKHSTVDVNDVEVEDVIREARENERKAAQEEQQKLQELQEEFGKSERDPIRELAELLDRADEEAEQVIAKRKKQNLHSCGVFGLGAAAVLGGMLYGLIDPVFALPLAAVYCMRAAVKYDRWART